MIDNIATSGLIATDPKHSTTAAGLDLITFRLASNQRRFNRATGKWESGDTNWYSVVAFRNLAANLANSVRKGDRIVVAGRMRVHEWTSEKSSGINVDIVADAVGHDLNWGTAVFNRSLGSISTADAAAQTAGSQPFDPDASSQAAVDSSGWAAPNAADDVRQGEAPREDSRQVPEQTPLLTAG